MPSQPFLGEIMLVGFNFAPRGWAQCEGQLLPINQNQSLYSLLGTTYGGDGRTTFALPDLRGRTPIHPGRPNGGNEIRLGEKGGEETVTLSANELPEHAHPVQISASGGRASERTPNDRVLARSLDEVYGEDTAAQVAMDADMLRLQATGGSQAHENMAPFLTANYCIALQGLFPSRT
jgi:microcystin-dependent protein